MTTVTIPLAHELNAFINEQVRLGRAPNKAELVRQAIRKMKEEVFIASLLQAEQEIKDGKALRGNLDILAKGF